MDYKEQNDFVDKMSKDEAKFLLIARGGLALYDADDKMLDNMIEKGLVAVVGFTHVKASNPIQGIVLSEEGIKLMNIVDNRQWDTPTALISQPPAQLQPNGADTATGAVAPAPVTSEENAIPALTVEGKPAPNAQERRHEKRK